MMYQVEFTKKETAFATPIISEKQKNIFIEYLDEKGISYMIHERNEEKKWHCVKVVFDMQMIEEALKAIADGTDSDKKYIYTFGDPTEEAKAMDVVKVQCTNGDVKTVFVVDVWLATADEIKDFKERIGYKKLGVVVEKIKGGK